MQPEEEHLLKIFQREGYTTGLSGKNHCFQKADLDRFDYVWGAGHGGPETPPDYAAAAARKFIADSKINRKAWGTATNPNPPESLGTALTVTHAIEFLDQNHMEPFFLWCSIADPHSPLQTSEPYASVYPQEDVPIPDQLDGEMETKPLAQQLDYYALAGDKVQEEDIRRITSMYYGMNTYIDNEVGRLLDKVEGLGLRENTLILYMSDHGEYLGEHRMIRKSKALYDCLIHIPLIASWPGRLPAGQRCEEFVEVVDIAPTILDAVALQHASGMQGRSFLPLLAGEDYECRDAIFSEQGAEDSKGRTIHTHTLDDLGPVPETPTSPDFSPSLKMGDECPVKCIRTREWKFVYYAGNSEGELYDIVDDPGELKNLWNRPEYNVLKAELTSRILDWLIQTEDRRPGLARNRN